MSENSGSKLNQLNIIQVHRSIHEISSYDYFLTSISKRAERQIKCAFLDSHKQKSETKKPVEENSFPQMGSSPVCKWGTLRLLINRKILFSELSAWYPSMIITSTSISHSKEKKKSHLELIEVKCKFILLPARWPLVTEPIEIPYRPANKLPKPESKLELYVRLRA